MLSKNTDFPTILIQKRLYIHTRTHTNQGFPIETLHIILKGLIEVSQKNCHI